MFLNTPIHSFLSVRQKNPFFQVFRLFVPHIFLFQTSFWKDNSSATSVIDNILYHATHGSKGLQEEVSNISPFTGQKPFIFDIDSLFIFAIFSKK